jgi:hypothetical protein
MVGEEHVKAVEFATTNTCCEGLADPALHWVTNIWANCKRAPHKDLFHNAEKKVTNATRGSSHKLHVPFCQALKKACLHYDGASQNHVCKLFCKESKLKYTKEVRIEKMMHERKYKNRVKTVYLPTKV